jgi:deoxyribonuclease-4
LREEIPRKDATMPHFGAHFSTAGGLHKAAATCRDLGCDAFQLFTKNPSQWAGKTLTDSDVTLFRDAVAAAGAKFVIAHDSYLINLAAADEALFEKSVAAFATEVQRADTLGVTHLVMHPGAHVGKGEEYGLTRVVEGLDAALDRAGDSAVRVLVEVTAGQGTTLGHRFEHLAAILSGVARPARSGICFDTCHAFAAGYDLRTRETYAATMAAFDASVGLKRIEVFHVNDSVKGLGSRVDRHAGLGLGEIGEAAFQCLVRDKRFRKVPMILETPKEDDAGEPMDPVNLAKLRAWLK